MGSTVDWSSPGAIATTLLDGNPIAILITLAVALLLPTLLHYSLYRKAANPASSSFILLGPSGAGKTSFLTSLESASQRAKTATPRTHTSQNPASTTIVLHPSVPIASNRYRSVNDPSLSEAKRNPVKYILRDTPGHGKLRSSQLSQLQNDLSSKEKSPIRGLIYFVDAALLADGAENLRDSAGYLHDVLLLLQKLVLSKNKSLSKAGASISVLIAANKQDLFTALPAGSIKERLELEIDRIRKSRQKGLMDASAGSLDNEDDEDLLGGDDGQGTFSFRLLENEIGTKVDVIGGSILSEEGQDPKSGVRAWEEWIGSCL
ncbi:putative SRP receptor beta subunit [Talaromyces proteolyticus]|uniref:Signal recognition particle receptor subunit beta n=1 Tax=Talaromyces proteolyticus TaxID=1131652 RepID=A0AAD4PZI3_9EURO|nr:putative SRP receptor beta subunit [Talaromyces proteolyticus]KAH8695918.1 putative SRP receptor beta subunit [Talaromyces proteolyticus]